MKTKNMLVMFCVVLLMVSLVSAKDFIVQNESNSSQTYFIVNGTTRDVTASGFFGDKYKLKMWGC